MTRGALLHSAVQSYSVSVSQAQNIQTDIPLPVVAKGYLCLFSVFDWRDVVLDQVRVAAEKDQVRFLLFLPLVFHIYWLAACTVSACPQRHLEYRLVI